MEEAYVLFSEILETETPKNEKIGKVVTQKKSHSTVFDIFMVGKGPNEWLSGQKLVNLKIP